MQRCGYLFARLTPHTRCFSASGLSTETGGKSKSPSVSDKPIVEPTTGAELVAAKKPVPLSTQVDFTDDVVAISGVPEEHVHTRRARVFVPARTAPQSGWNNTKTWKIELDNRERWENPLMGWASTGDPLSNISGNMDFARKEDAIRFCIRQGWEYEVEDPQQMKVKPKSYGSNYAWNSKTKIWTK